MYDQVGFNPGFQGWVNIQEINRCNQHIHKLVKKNHKIISTDAEKASDNIRHSWQLKKLKKEKIYKTRNREELPQLEKKRFSKNLQLTLYFTVK